MKVAFFVSRKRIITEYAGGVPISKLTKVILVLFVTEKLFNGKNADLMGL